MLRELVARLADSGARLIITSTYKSRPDNLARMRRLPEVGERVYRLYREKGVRVGGYTYLPRSLREELLRPVIEEAKGW